MRRSLRAVRTVGLEIEVPDWYADQAQLHFCDASCRRAWTEAIPSLEVCLGELLPNGKGGEPIGNSKR